MYVMRLWNTCLRNAKGVENERGRWKSCCVGVGLSSHKSKREAKSLGVLYIFVLSEWADDDDLIVNMKCGQSVYLQPEKKRREPADCDVTWKLWWIRKLVKGTYFIFFRVDAFESISTIVQSTGHISQYKCDLQIWCRTLLFMSGEGLSTREPVNDPDPEKKARSSWGQSRSNKIL